MKPGAIEARYSGEILKFDKNQGDYICDEVGIGSTTKDRMMIMAEERNTTMLVVGYHGRKGPKSDPTVLGSAVQHLGVNSYCPVAIVKVRNIRSSKANGAMKWCVCFDGAPSSMEGFEQILKLMDRDRDSIEVITIQLSTMNVDMIKEKAEGFLKTHGIKGSFTAIPKHHG
jgi:hypothetical protein